LLDRAIPGIAEALRQANRDRCRPGAVSCVAGHRRRAGVTLPGSPVVSETGWLCLSPLIGHALDQLAGSDHRPGGGV